MSLAARTLRLLAVAAAALPAAAMAQARPLTLDTVSVTAPRTRADSLDDKAIALYNSPKQWRQAAYLHQIAASLRPLGDVRGISSLTMSANLLYALRDLASARMVMEHAGDYAWQRGEFGRAAIAYVDAGYIALEMGNRGRAEQLGRKAQAIAQSPFMSADERALIKRRVGGEGHSVALVTP